MDPIAVNLQPYKENAVRRGSDQQSVSLFRLSVLPALSLLLILSASCRQPTPEEELVEKRSNYTARLNEGGFLVREEPIEPGIPDEEPDEADVAAAEEGDPMEEAMGPAVNQFVTLDIIVQHDNRDPLPGVTLDISMVDPDQNEKGHWRMWVDTEGLPKATQKQVSFVLENPGYVENDGFHVEVRHPVPLEERSEYQEFAVLDAGP